MFVHGVRNGLFHDGITKKGIFINASQNEIFARGVEDRVINPHRFFEVVKSEFTRDITELKKLQNSNLRTNFEKMWDFKKGI